MDYDRPDTDSMLAAFMDSDFSRDEKAWNEEVGKIVDIDDAYLPEPDAEGNYSTPVLERLREAWQEYQHETLDEDRLLDLIDGYLETVDRWLTVLQQAVQEGLDDAGNPVTHAIRTGFEEYRSSLQSMRAFCTSHDQHAMESGLSAAQQASNRLLDAFGFFQRMRAAVAHQPCPHCSVENHKSSTRCNDCGAALPGLPDQPGQRLLAVAAEGVALDENAAVSTPNFQRITAALAAWGVHELDDEGLLADIEEVEANVLAHQEANQEERSDTGGLTGEEQKLVSGLLDEIDDALDGHLDALAEMKRYWEDHHPEHVRAGYEALSQATQQMLEAFQESQNITSRVEAGAAR